MNIVVIHDNDADGICAAWCIDKAFPDANKVFIPQRAGDNNIEWALDLPNPLNTHVYLVDRSYPRHTLNNLAELCRKVIVIDHHKTAHEDLVDQYLHTNIDLHIDLNHSACALAFDYAVEYGENTDFCECIPWFIEYIEDRDMWWWKLRASKQYNTALYILGHSFETYDNLYDEYLNSKQDIYFTALYDMGDAALKMQHKIVQSLTEGNTVGYYWMKFPETEFSESPALVAVLSCPFSLISEVGNYLLTYQGEDRKCLTPDVVLCHQQTYEITTYTARDKTTYSIRSKEKDMSGFAKSMGGGGHPKACGFSTFDVFHPDILNHLDIVVKPLPSASV
jgi:oligoribonuclease NrnB/cAMP/cGMP phosphodiesterase (DHH superfamily)